MGQPDYYQILGVDENADPKTIEAAYWRLLREYQPDTYQGADAKEKIGLVNAAYEVLSNPRRRAEYDTSLERLREEPALHSSVAVSPRAERTTPKAGIWRLVAFVLVLVFVAVVVAWVLGSRGGGTTNPTAIGQDAPEIALPDLGGEMVSLASLRGKVVLINFWATWCPPCREEMPDIEDVYRRFKDRGFVVLAVNLQEDSGTVAEFVQRLGLSFTIVLDTSGEVSETYRVFSLPTSYFVDRDGVIRDANIGGMTRDIIEAKLEKIM